MRQGLARLLRALADSLDPPENAKRRQHPGLAAPAKLETLQTAQPVRTVPDAAPPRPTRVWLPGEWGGPYIRGGRY